MVSSTAIFPLATIAFTLVLIIVSQLLQKSPQSYSVESRSPTHHYSGGLDASASGRNNARQPYWDPSLTLADGLSSAGLAAVWKNCSGGIYLDLGTNIGVQIRKLYQPHQFPGAPVLDIFKAKFGEEHSRRHVCTVGFEPNPHHTELLNKLNSYFESQGFPALILTEVALSSERGTAEFYFDPQAEEKYHEYGASLSGWQQTSQKVTVKKLDLAEFINTFVKSVIDAEKARTGTQPPVLAKMDIEGGEYTVVPGMITRGALCHVDTIFVEWHEWMRATLPNHVSLTGEEMVEYYRKLTESIPDCQVEFIDLDDETYGQTVLPT